MKRTMAQTTTFLLLLLVFLPTKVAFAADSVQEFLSLISNFINNTLIPFLFALVMLFLFVNVFRYFIVEGADTASREQARQYMLWAVIALVFLSSIWGIIALFINAFDINTRAQVCPDYNPDCGSSQYNDDGGYYNGSSIYDPGIFNLTM